MTNNFIINVSVVVFNKNREVLLCHRSPQEDVFPNLWGIPGGKVESEDSSLEEGLRREVQEEVGVDIKDIQLISNNIRPKSAGIYVVFMVYRAFIAGGEPRALEDTDEVKWYEFANIKPSTLTPYTYEIIEKSFVNLPPR